jgi:diguanylate cyclase (GGDEF)-like protein
MIQLTAPPPVGAVDVLRRSAALFALGVVVVAGLSWLPLTKYEQGRTEIIAAQERGAVRLAEQLIRRDYFEVGGDLRLVAQSPDLTDYLDQPDAARLRRVQQLFLLLSATYGRYDQIRYLDATGQEVIRVNYTEGQALVVPGPQLQNKADRPYFQEAMKLRRGEIHASPMDLNVEHQAIERPWKPVIRLATPVFDSRGAKQGVVVLNFLADRMRETLDQAIPSAAGQLFMVLNEDGYWLIHPDRTKEFGFMFHDAGRRFQNDYPAEWRAISAQAEGVLRTEHGLFVHAVIAPLRTGVRQEGHLVQEGASGGRMYLIVHVPGSALAAGSVFKRPLTAALLVVVLLALAALALASSYVRLTNQQRLAQEHYGREKMEALAHTDDLTGIANRRYFTLLAEREVERAVRSHRPLSLLVLDIDHFKHINDRYGHAVGDLALQAFRRACEQVLRRTDIFGRIGGEEFAILMPETDLHTALAVSERLREAVAHISVEAPDGVVVSFTVSIGVSEIDGGRRLDELLAKADAALYRAKQAGRNRVVSDAEPAAGSGMEGRRLDQELS